MNASSATQRQPQSFRYAPLVDACSEIRLLTIIPGRANDPISCTLRHADLQHPFTCLSYCWGPDRDHRAILVDGKRFLVRGNLYNFLETARVYSFSHLLWIDAICINQQAITRRAPK